MCTSPGADYTMVDGPWTARSFDFDGVRPSVVVSACTVELKTKFKSCSLQVASEGCKASNQVGQARASGVSRLATLVSLILLPYVEQKTDQ